MRPYFWPPLPKISIKVRSFASLGQKYDPLGSVPQDDCHFNIDSCSLRQQIYASHHFPHLCAFPLSFQRFNTLGRSQSYPFSQFQKTVFGAQMSQSYFHLESRAGPRGQKYETVQL